MEKKKYYWLKLREDFFKQKEIKKLRRMAGGDTYTVVYLKLQLLSVKNGGIILFESVEDNLADELALELDESPDDVQMTLLFLEKHRLIEQTASDEYLLPEAVKNIGTESASAERMRQHRQRQQEPKNLLVSQCDAHVTERDEKVTLEKEKDIRERLYPPLPPHGEGEQSSESLAGQMAAGTGTLVGHSMTLIASFEDFWNAYPRKEGKGAAEKAWGKTNPTIEIMSMMLEAIKAANSSSQWQRENGRYIPAPAKWLNQKRWLDQPKTDDRTGSASYDLAEIETMLDNIKGGQHGH